MGCGCNKNRNNPPVRQRVIKKTINSNVRPKKKVPPQQITSNTNYKNPTPRKRK